MSAKQYANQTADAATYNKKFTVLGEDVEVLSSSDATGGAFAIVAQTCAPGGGPPPHIHDNEDEFFYPVYGEFEMFDGEIWMPLTKAGTLAPRGAVHTFRNCGKDPAQILCLASPGSLDLYLEAISTVTMPQDAERLQAISERYGVTFVTG